MTTIDTTRRKLLLRALFGAGGVGLRALATGVPASFLLSPSDAHAQDACADKSRAQYLIFSTSGAGDPLNANVPGTYDFADIAHSPDPRMTPTSFKLGATTVKAAQVWSTLPQNVLDRTVFFHHGTYTNNHPNLPKVLKLMGATAKSEMLVSVFAKQLATCFGTIQREPLSIGAGDILTFDGRSLANLPPRGLRDLLAQPDSPLNRLQQLRDKSIDELHNLLKQQGTSDQRRFLDSVAVSRQQARSLSSDLLDMLSGIMNDSSDGQVVAAVALIRMNVAPIVTIRIEFGGDNHTDADLAKSEAPQHEIGIGRINQMMTLLAQAGLADKVTFAANNVFGRTLKKKGTTGRDHWGSHHATVMIGKNLRGGVVGGLEPKSGDYVARAIDSKTGAGVAAGDVPFEDTLGAMGKTLGAALGVSSAALDANVSQGKVVAAALA
jgi:hypothetical protein